MSRKVTEREELVEVLVPRVPGNKDPNKFVGVNGVNYIIPRGKKTEVPAAVAYELKRSMAAEDVQAETEEILRSKANG